MIDDIRIEQSVLAQKGAAGTNGAIGSPGAAWCSPDIAVIVFKLYGVVKLLTLPKPSDQLLSRILAQSSLFYVLD